MLSVEQKRYNALLDLAREHFEITPGDVCDRVLCDSTRAGDPEILQTSLNERPDCYWDGPRLDSRFIRWLATDPQAVEQLDPAGIRVNTAVICGELDFFNCHGLPLLDFRFCVFQERPEWSLATLDSLMMSQSTLCAGMNGLNVHLSGSLNLVDTEIIRDVNFEGAHIDGSVLIAKTKFSSAGPALSLRYAVIGGTVKWDSPSAEAGFVSAGPIDMLEVRVGGDLLMYNARLLATAPYALRLTGAHLGGSLQLTAARIEGPILAAQITVLGSLQCNGAVLKSQGDAFVLAASRIHGGASFSELSQEDGTVQPFECVGALDLSSADISTVLDCTGSSIGSLVCRAMKADDLLWKKIVNPEGAKLDLTAASLRWLHDEQASWPAKDNLKIDGMLVDEIPDLDGERLQWIALQSDPGRTQPQPWMHIAKHLREKGHAKEAKRAVYRLRMYQAEALRDRETAQARASGKARGSMRSHFAFAWKWVMSGLEEQPLRILWSLAVCWCFGTTVFWTSRAHFSETGDAAYRVTHLSQPQSGAVSGAYPKFLPPVYALELALPVVRLGQDERWAPDARLNPECGENVYGWLVCIRWFLILSGWLQAIVLVAALNARFHP